MFNLRNAPIPILIAGILIAAGGGFNIVMGLLLSLAPQKLIGIEVTSNAIGAPSQLLLVAGVACLAFGFVFLWVLRELFNKSNSSIVMIYTISIVNILFGLFRLPFGFLTISVNLLVIYLVHTKSAKQWLSSPE